VHIDIYICVEEICICVEEIHISVEEIDISVEEIYNISTMKKYINISKFFIFWQTSMFSATLHHIRAGILSQHSQEQYFQRPAPTIF